MPGAGARPLRRCTDSRLAALDPTRPNKPLDLGNGIVAGSVTPDGRWLSLGRAHSVQGRVVLTDAPPFPDELRHDQRAVRAYRAALAAPERAGFGLALLHRAGEAYLIEDGIPLAVHEIQDAIAPAVHDVPFATAHASGDAATGGRGAGRPERRSPDAHARRRPSARVEVTTFAPARRAGAVQVLRIAAREAPFHFDAAWTGTILLRRAAYTQLTEGGPLPPESPQPQTGGDADLRWFEDRALGAAAIALPRPVTVATGTSERVIAAIALASGREAAIAEAFALRDEGPALLRGEVAERRRFWRGIDRDGTDDRSRAVRRGVGYALDCAASSTGDVVAILADHEILPLVWTRDAYYVCAALRTASSEPRAAAVVRGFVRWLFEVAERPGGWWPRSSLASGATKDLAFQLDQQLYPLLLARETAAYEETAREVIERLLARRSPFGLVATSETPADDELPQPFHFSSHVLLWHVLARFGHPAGDEVRDATRTHFTADSRFAYAVAGPHGAAARHYHDANDLPLVFAPGWGFCPADDLVWRATVDFAWSPENAGYFPGRLAGLGSLHSPHPWPLGDLQRVIVGRLRGDAAAEAEAWSRLGLISMTDGLLPEAYDEETGAVASRHWFAWPAALRAFLAAYPIAVAP